jgi:hypothetical protein
VQTRETLRISTDKTSYDQSDHSAKYVGWCHDSGFVESPAEWQRFETMLSAWIDLIERGKIVALDSEARRELSSREIGKSMCTQDSAPFDRNAPGAVFNVHQSDPWETALYSKQDLQDALSAWHALVEAINKRMPEPKEIPFIASSLFSAKTLLAAGIRENSFAWHFLRNAHRPSFDYLGPSLRLATESDLVNSIWKSTNDAYVPASWRPSSIDPVYEPGPFPIPLLLGTASAKNWHSRSANAPSAAIEQVPWGLYLDERHDFLLTEDACRLVLPYDLGDNGFAVRADGSKLEDRNVNGWAELYQLGQHPHVPCHGTQLFQVLEAWRESVTRGWWKVGSEGIDELDTKFGDADTEEWPEAYMVVYYDMRART